MLVFGAPVAVFTGIGRASWPARERTPPTQWGWRDLYGNLRQGLLITSQHTLLGELTDDASDPATRTSAQQPRSDTH